MMFLKLNFRFEFVCSHSFVMLYPVRQLRKRQNREYAKTHILQEISKRQCQLQSNQQSSKTNEKHVSFSGQLDVCSFNASVNLLNSDYC